MKRSALLTTVLMFMVLGHWIFTFYYYKRLPMKLMIPGNEEMTLIAREFFFAFPAMTTLLTLAVMLASRIKHIIPFWGKSELKNISPEIAAPVYDRSFQVLTMVAIFISMVAFYIQFNLALFSTQETQTLDLGAVLAVSPIILIYLGFNQFILKRMAESCRQHAELVNNQPG